MTRRNRMFATALILLLAAVTLLSAAYVAEHTEHECHGGDCPVCEQIAVCERALERLSAAAVAAVIAALTVLFVRSAARCVSAFALPRTLVLLKIKLSD